MGNAPPLMEHGGHLVPWARMHLKNSSLKLHQNMFCFPCPSEFAFGELHLDIPGQGHQPNPKGPTNPDPDAYAGLIQ